jgi:hypothetical protein
VTYSLSKSYPFLSLQNPTFSTGAVNFRLDGAMSTDHIDYEANLVATVDGK